MENQKIIDALLSQLDFNMQAMGTIMSMIDKAELFDPTVIADMRKLNDTNNTVFNNFMSLVKELDPGA